MSNTISPENSVEHPVPKRERLPSIDILRGFVMAIMALDHVRDYFSIDRGISWMDPEQSRAELMVTRWFAQLCAPAFFLLAGMGVFLSLSGGKSKRTIAGFLIKRGLFLILLDLTLVRIAWDFNFRYDGGLWFIVLTCLGASMIVLAGLIYLPNFWIIVVSLVIIGGCNLLDPRPAVEKAPAELKTAEDPLGDEVKEDLDIPKTDEGWGRFEPLRTLLHSRAGDTLFGIDFYVTYSLFPWLGIMSLGYGIGPVLKMESSRRRRRLFLIGLSFLVTFVVLRYFRLYGDPRPWDPHPENPLTYLAFFRTKKYPTSLQHVLLTLAPLLLALAMLDRIKTPNAIGRWFVQFGRAPLFFYLLHIYVLHALAVLVGWAQGYKPTDMLELYLKLPENFGFGLPGVFLVWLVVLAICFPICLWFDRVKRRSKSVWLSYL
ncbi:MAG: heparan-alpha-glucosaminide N-acetyltransferase domain-containing protein [Planctomycetes bacterium]|nr:heparan-alpha-glucosaminide N-acetyltransferase domain-containing protein [Planctomycetota bacterium]